MIKTVRTSEIDRMYAIVFHSFWFISAFLTATTAGSMIVDDPLYCASGRPALWIFNMSTFRLSTRCSISGRPCFEKKGVCSKENLCCPHLLKMSSKSSLYDRITDIQFNRIDSDYKNAYRLFELKLVKNKKTIYDYYFRWLFFDDTLRDLYEMPNANFRYSMKNCLQNHGITYVIAPLNSTSITTNISAILIVTRQNTTFHHFYICYMATRKEHRRQGLATRLLQQIVQRALNEQRNGIKNITLHVNTLNRVALELYERCGWRCYEYLPNHLEPEPHHATNHAYGLVLRLQNVKNITNLCRQSDAVDVKQAENQHSIDNCRRIPVHL